MMTGYRGDGNSSLWEDKINYRLGEKDWRGRREDERERERRSCLFGVHWPAPAVAEQQSINCCASRRADLTNSCRPRLLPCGFPSREAVT